MSDYQETPGELGESENELMQATIALFNIAIHTKHTSPNKELQFELDRVRAAMGEFMAGKKDIIIWNYMDGEQKPYAMTVHANGDMVEGYKYELGDVDNGLSDIFLYDNTIYDIKGDPRPLLQAAFEAVDVQSMGDLIPSQWFLETFSDQLQNVLDNGVMSDDRIVFHYDVQPADDPIQ